MKAADDDATHKWRPLADDPEGASNQCKKCQLKLRFPRRSNRGGGTVREYRYTNGEWFFEKRGVPPCSMGG